MLNRFTKPLSLFVCLVGLSYSQTEAAQKAAEKRFKIFMVLWSGETDLKKGFQSYLEQNGVKADYIVRDCKADKKLCHSYVQEIRQEKPDLIYTWGTPACTAIGGPLDAPNKQDYIWDIPMVSLVVTDPVRSNLVETYEKTGRNITGVNHVPPIETQFNAIKSYYPKLKKVAALYNPAEGNSVIQVKELISKQKELGLEVVDMPIQLDEAGKPMPDMIPTRVLEISNSGAEMIYIPADTFFSNHCVTAVNEANKYGLGTFGATDSLFMKDRRPLMGLISRWINVGTFGGYKAKQILLEGKKPQEVPYEKLSRFSFVVSGKTLHKLKHYPPMSIMPMVEFIKN